jgi:nanoRNase/pAp phosphatase (c-di-AMP/oligoRNAs hydrolase)
VHRRQQHDNREAERKQDDPEKILIVIPWSADSDAEASAVRVQLALLVQRSTR